MSKKNMVLATLIFTKLINVQQHYIGIFYISTQTGQ